MLGLGQVSLALAMLGVLVAWPTARLVRVLHAQLIGEESGAPDAVAAPAECADGPASPAAVAPVAVVEADPGHSLPYVAWEGWVAAVALVVLWALVGLRMGLGPRAPLALLACWVGAVVLPLDWRLRLIPDVVVLPGTLAAVGLHWWLDGTPVPSLLGAGTGLVFWGLIWLLGVLIYRSVSAFGLGDVKLGIFVGAVLGTQAALLAFVIGILVGGIVAVGVILTRLRKRRQPIPYGPFIIAGMLLVLMIGRPG